MVRNDNLHSQLLSQIYFFFFLPSQLDHALCEFSPVYESFRQKGSISHIRLFTVNKGTFVELRKYLLHNNPAAANQVKIPRVIKTKQALDVVLNNIHWPLIIWINVMKAHGELTTTVKPSWHNYDTSCSQSLIENRLQYVSPMREQCR